MLNFYATPLFNNKRTTIFIFTSLAGLIFLLIQYHQYAVRSAIRQVSNIKHDWEDDHSNEGVTQNPIEFPVTHLNYPDFLTTDERVKLERLQPIVESSSTRQSSIKSLYRVDGRKDWLNHIGTIDDADLYPFTKLAQRRIYDHQNPPSCEAKRFFSLNCMGLQGLGSALHVIAEALAFSMFHDRILVINIDGCNMLSDFVEDQKDAFAILFEPLSSCQAYAESNPHQIDMALGPFDRWSFGKTQSTHGICPAFLAEAMKLVYPDITANALKVWTRAQMVGYSARLRHAVIESLYVLRQDMTMSQGWSQGSTEITPFPLPPNTWSMHIRHGDKGREMKLVPFEAFARAAEQYTVGTIRKSTYTTDELQMMNPLQSRKYAFVSSEDASVFEELKQSVSFIETETTHNLAWHWWYSNIPRINSGPLQQLYSSSNRTAMTVIWMSQLFLALECDAFVGTRNSNWNRLIDELRGVWIGSARAPFLEVSRQRDWVNYHW